MPDLFSSPLDAGAYAGVVLAYLPLGGWSVAVERSETATQYDGGARLALALAPARIWPAVTLAVQALRLNVVKRQCLTMAPECATLR